MNFTDVFKDPEFYFIDFLYWLPVSILISTLIFIISLPLLDLELLCSSLSTFLKLKLMWGILDLSSYIRIQYHKFHSVLLSLRPTNFDKLCFSFIWFKILLNFFWHFFLWPKCHLEVCYLISMYLGVFPLFFCYGLLL